MEVVIDCRAIPDKTTVASLDRLREQGDVGKPISISQTKPEIITLYKDSGSVNGRVRAIRDDSSPQIVFE